MNNKDTLSKTFVFLILAVALLLIVSKVVVSSKFNPKASPSLVVVEKAGDSLSHSITTDKPVIKWHHQDNNIQLKYGSSEFSNRTKLGGPIRKTWGHGYAMAFSYADQLTAGSVNLLSLQCWVKSLGSAVRVVEPFLEGSHWGVGYTHLSSDLRKMPRLFNVFDTKQWQSFSSAKNLASIAKWEEFLEQAPPNLILVGSGCSSVPDISLQNATANFARKYRFKLVRKVCHNESVVFTPMKFRSEIYGSLKPANSVVLFHKWPGISKTIVFPPHLYRVAITGVSRCERSSSIKKFMDWIPLSAQIKSNGKKYINKYLSSNTEYIAVMFRIEQMFIKHSLQSHSDRIREGTKCISSILWVVQKLRGHFPKGEVFLSMDSGKYGSEAFRDQNSSDAITLSRNLFDRLYSHSSLTYKNWEKSFEDVADFITPGYVAMLQLNIAMNARVLVLAGGGSFQSIADRDIKLHHRGKKVYRVLKC